jgi:hypothetical protein
MLSRACIFGAGISVFNRYSFLTVELLNSKCNSNRSNLTDLKGTYIHTHIHTLYTYMTYRQSEHSKNYLFSFKGVEYSETCIRRNLNKAEICSM